MVFLLLICIPFMYVNHDDKSFKIKFEYISLFIFLRFTIIYEKRLLLGCIHHFKSDLINNMDHMRISGT